MPHHLWEDEFLQEGFELLLCPVVGQLVQQSPQILALDGLGRERKEEVVAGLSQLRHGDVRGTVDHPTAVKVQDGVEHGRGHAVRNFELAAEMKRRRKEIK